MESINLVSRFYSSQPYTFILNIQYIKSQISTVLNTGAIGLAVNRMLQVQEATDRRFERNVNLMSVDVNIVDNVFKGRPLFCSILKQKQLQKLFFLQTLIFCKKRS